MSDASPPAEVSRIRSLQRSEQLFRTLCDSAPVAMLCADPTGNVAYLNRACRRLVGRDSSTAMENDWRDWIVADDKRRWSNEWDRAAKSDSELEAELRIVRPDGEIIWVRAVASLRMNDQSKVEGYVVALTKIDRTTAVKKVERFLEAENELLETFARGIPLHDGLEWLVDFIEDQSDDVIASVLLFDSEQRCLRHGAAPRMSAEFNAKVDGLPIGEGMGSCGTAAARCQPVVVQDIETDPLWREFRDEAGSEGVRACWSTPIQDSQGVLLGTFAIYRSTAGRPSKHHQRLIDTATHLASLLLARHRDLQSLEWSQEQLRMTKFCVDSCSVAVFWVRRDASYSYVNDAAQERFGYTRDEWLSMSVHDIDDNFTQETWPEAWAQVKREGSLTFESTIRHKGGEVIPVEITTSYLEYQDHEFCCAFVSDITSRKQMERNLRENVDRLELAMSVNNDGIYDWNVDTNELFFDQRFYTMAGYAPNEFPANYGEWAKRVHPDDSPVAEQGIAEFLAGQRSAFDEEYRFLRKDGDWMWVRARVRVIDRLESGRPKRIVGTHTDLTAQKLADEALRLSEAKYADLYENSPDMMCSINAPEGSILQCNSTMATTLGRPKQEMIGAKVFDFVAPESLDRIRTVVFPHFLETGNVDGEELKLLCADGSVRDVILKSTAVRSESGKVISSRSVLRDITERKRAESRLAESESLFRNLVQTAPFGVQRNDVGGTITFANDALGTIYGCDPEQLVGRSVFDFAVDESARRAMVTYVNRQSIHLETPPRVFETTNRTLDGRMINVNVNWSYDCDTDGNLLGFIVIITDVTARRQSERDLEFQADVLNRVSDAVLVTSSDGNINYANEAANRLYCQIGEEGSKHTLAQRHQELLAAARFNDQVRISLGETGVWQGEQELPINGDHRWFETKLKTIPSRSGGDPLLLSVIRDISTRRKAEQENRRHRDLLAHFARLSTMGELVAGIAHEVKQPLYAISNFSTAVSVALGEWDKADGTHAAGLDGLKECNDGIRQASECANEIIRRLREFARRGETTREAIDLNDVIADSVNLVAFKAREIQALVQLQLDDTIPAIHADRIQCEQVIVNLLNNAYEAIADIDGDRDVVVRTLQQNDLVELQISDNGPGVAAEAAGKIFETFYTTKRDGMGMGLAISRTIVEDHGGRLWVTSHPGGGAIFHVTFPAAVSEERRYAHGDALPDSV